MCACQKDDVTPELQKNDGEQFTFAYNGNTYSSAYEELEDGEIVLLDEKIDALRQRILEFPELITVYSYDGSVEYFENEDLATKRLNERTLFKENAFTRGHKVGCYVNNSQLIVYNETNYKGTNRTYNNTVSVPQLWRIPEISFSVSSFKLSCSFYYQPIGQYPSIGKKNVFARFYTGYDYTGKQSWWRLDYDLQAQNISSVPKDIRGKVLSLKVEHTMN
jgi:hypothetical protein